MRVHGFVYRLAAVVSAALAVYALLPIGRAEAATILHAGFGADVELPWGLSGIFALGFSGQAYTWWRKASGVDVWGALTMNLSGFWGLALFGFLYVRHPSIRATGAIYLLLALGALISAATLLRWSAEASGRTAET